MIDFHPVTQVVLLCHTRICPADRQTSLFSMDRTVMVSTWIIVSIDFVQVHPNFSFLVLFGFWNRLGLSVSWWSWILSLLQLKISWISNLQTTLLSSWIWLTPNQCLEYWHLWYSKHSRRVWITFVCLHPLCQLLCLSQLFWDICLNQLVSSSLLVKSILIMLYLIWSLIVNSVVPCFLRYLRLSLLRLSWYIWAHLTKD